MNSKRKTQNAKLLASFLLIAAVGLPALLVAPLPTTAQREMSGYLAQYGQPVRVVFGGDIMLGRAVDAMMQQKGDDYPFAAISNTLHSADLAVANLESSLTNQPIPVRPDSQWINLKGRPEAAKALARAGFGLLTIANNHALDYGGTGLSDTVAALDAAGLRHIGTSDQPIIVTIKGLRLAFLGYDCVATAQPPAGTLLAAIVCSGPQLAATEAALKAEVGNARAHADVVIVFIHWGVEYGDAPSNFQAALAQSLADDGATLIVGAHPHVAQGMARLGNALVVYSLGNFVFDQRTPAAAQTGMLLDVSFDRSGIASATLRPLNTYLQTRLLSDGDPPAAAAIANAARSSDAAMQWQAVSPLPPSNPDLPPAVASTPIPTLALAYWREQQPDGLFADLNGDGRSEWIGYHPGAERNPVGSLNVYQQTSPGPFEWWRGDTALAATGDDVVMSAAWQPAFRSEPQMQVHQFAFIPHYGSLPAVIFNFWQPDYRWGGQGQLKNQLCVYGWLIQRRQWGQLWCGRPLPTVAQRISVVEAADGNFRLGVLWGDDPTQAAMTVWSAPGFTFLKDWQSAGRGYTRLVADDAGHRFLYKLKEKRKMSHKRLGRLASLLLVAVAMQLALSACDLNPSKTPTPAPTATSAAAAASPTTIAMAATATTATQPSPTTAVVMTPTQAVVMTPTQAVVMTPTMVMTPTAALPVTPTAVLPVTPTATVDNSAPTVNRPLLTFANFTVPNTSVQPSIAPYTVQPDLSDVQNPAQYTLSDAQKALVAKNLFVVSPPAEDVSQQYPGGLKEFYQLYEAYRYGSEPVFVSSDSILHVYHLVFDKMLRDLETNKLTGELVILSDAMLRVSDAQHSDIVKLNNPDLTAASEQLVAYFAVADKLVNSASATPAYVSDKVTAELALINAHGGLAPSNIFTNYMEDYGQYEPRGHYTRTPALEQYFKAMIWYGRMTFRQEVASETLSAVLLTELLGSQQTLRSGPILDHWKNIYEPTVFIVGKADDLSYFDYQPAIQAVYGSATPSLQDLADPAKLATLQGAINKMPPPLINSMFVFATEDKTQATKGLRMMGQRFTLDEYVIGQLTWRNVGTALPDGNPDVVRWLPRALDVPAAMGSDQALNIITQGTQLDYGQGQGPAALHYDTQMQKVRQSISALSTSDWTQNLYWSWLYTLKPLAAPVPSGYPSFMTSQAWQDKQLTTYLGSYTELKHDTILYAKQSMAEKGGGPPTIVKGYVEPQPELYARLSALTQLTIDGLKSRNLLDQPTEQRLNNMQDTVSQMLTITLQELQNQPLTDDQYTFIMYYGGTIEDITLSTADPQCDPGTPPDQCQGRPTDLSQFDSALAADIASDPNGNALQETDGRPYEIYAVVPIDGQKVLSRGAVFSQYEFVVPSSGRLTDDAWKAQLDAGKAPAFADWTKSYAIQK